MASYSSEQSHPQIYTDMTIDELTQKAVENKEGLIAANQAFVVTTGLRTGRSPKDKFIVKDKITEHQVHWGDINKPIEKSIFDTLWDKAITYLSAREQFIGHLQVGSDARYGIPVKVMTEFAWHQLFARHLFVCPEDIGKTKETVSYAWTIINVPGLKLNPEEDKTYSDAAVMLDFTERRVLICGMRYAGEMKKAMFTVLNFLLPSHDVLPMHCGASLYKKNEHSALFFGLSGTGKTTLSADPECLLIGDDEHGWSANGIFNFEGGCYAKCIHLSKKREPVIWDAIRKGSIMENVVLDAEGKPDFDDTSLTKNTRAAYPLTHISGRVLTSQGGHPHAVLFLTCDLYGVLPPVSCLNKFQAAYYFLSGYTALVGSTEVGSSRDIESTFSACFGAPFFPLSPVAYAQLLMKRLEETQASVYLVNTGWHGGGYHTGGKRFPIDFTRSIVRAILNDEVKTASKQHFPGFDFSIPTALPGVDSKLLDPRITWQDKSAYERDAALLRKQFIENFKQFSVSDDMMSGGPKQDE